LPFEEEKNPPPPPKTGVKLNNANSVLNKVPKKPSKEAFEAKAVEVNKQLNVYGDRAFDLATRFKKVLDDKTLIENKTTFIVDAEKELIGQLIQLCEDMNTDEHEKMDMGTFGLLALLFRTTLIQRDKINSLDYRLNLLEKKMKDADLTPKDK
jgi:hypothetical protein